MAKKGRRKSKEAKSKASPKPSPEAKEVGAPVIEPEIGVEKGEVAQQPPVSPEAPKPGAPTFEPESISPPMVNLRAKIHDVGMLTITVPEAMVDETLEKIWRTGFKQKLANIQRTHQVYGPHMIDRIDVEPVQ